MSLSYYTNLKNRGEDEDGVPLIKEEKEDKESNSGQETKKNLSKRQIIFIAVFIILILCVAAALAVLLHKKSNWYDGGSKVLRSDRKFTLEEILGGKYSFPSYSVNWISDNDYIHNENGWYIFHMNSSKTETVFEGREYEESSAGTTSMSPDNKWLLFSNKSAQLYRHSFYADYYIKDLRPDDERSNKSLPRIVKIITPDQDRNAQIRYCGWANDQNAFVFVYKCNIYYASKADNVVLKYYKLTDDGVPKKIFNGVPDWVYEEEIIASTHAIEFSKDGRYISYVKFNATDVPYYKFPKYGYTGNQYTSIEKIAYPKAGYPNPTIKITVADLHDIIKNGNGQEYRSKRTHPKPHEQVLKGEYYYAVMKWTTGDELLIQWLNRAQNETYCVAYEPTKNEGRTVEAHTTPNGWIDDDYVKPKFAKDGSYYITMLPKDDMRHLAKVSLKDNGGIDFLTEGSDYWVQDINCYDKDEEVVYFRSTEASPRYRQIYSIDVKTKEKKCVSCGVIQDSGTNCTYHYPTFSKQCTWVTLFCQGPFVPVTYMYNVKTGRKYSLTNNEKTKELLKERDVPTTRYYTVKSDGYDIPVKETRPVNFDENKKYAVLFDVYGGPNTQKVKDTFSLGVSEYMISKNDIILINFDARGTGFYGYKFLHSVYKKLGYYEAIDANNVAKHLQTLKYVDPKRIAIWGWSYGGFYAATVLAMPDGVINTAVSVAPVSDWRYYDTVYSERYMGFPTPQENLKGYQDTSVMSRAENFRGKNFMVLHGTGDDNVHFQNSAQLVNSLIRSKIKFRTMFFPDRRHDIASNGYVYYQICDFLIYHLTKSHKSFPLNGTFGFNMGNFRK